MTPLILTYQALTYDDWVTILQVICLVFAAILFAAWSYGDDY